MVGELVLISGVMMKRRALASVLAVTTLAAGSVVATSGVAEAAVCDGGTYNFKKVYDPGACAWGNVTTGSTSTASTIRVAVVLRDKTPTDGNCAVLTIQVLHFGGIGNENYNFYQCGAGSKTIDKTYYSTSWVIQGIRINVGSGGGWSSWKNYSFV